MRRTSSLIVSIPGPCADARRRIRERSRQCRTFEASLHSPWSRPEMHLWSSYASTFDGMVSRISFACSVILAINS
jgi:hypothetical protein